MTDRHTPIISVIMAVYNGERYLAEAVESVLQQSFSDFEFIIIDDGSTDTSPQILSDYAGADPRIRLVTHENRGLTRCLNEAIDLARGRFVARMDGDDICLPERFAKQVAFLDQHPTIGLLGTGTQLISAEGEHIRTDPPRGTTNGVLRWLNFFGTPYVHPSVMMRREVVTAVGGYDTDFISAQDRDLWDRLLTVTQVANLPDILLRSRLHTHNVSRTRRSEQLHNAAKVAHRAMSTYLSTSLAFELCEAMEHETFTSPDQIALIEPILTRLYTAFLAQEELQPEEVRFVRDDYAHRLFRMARSWPSDPRMLKLLLAAIKTSPSLVLEWLNKQARRASRERS